MIKNLLIIGLSFYSCGSNYNKQELDKDSLNNRTNTGSLPESISKKQVVDSNFLAFWGKFVTILKSKNLSELKKMSFDSLIFEEKEVSKNEFVNSYFSTAFDDSLRSLLSDDNRVEFFDEAIDASYLPKSVINQLKNERIITKKVNIIKVNKYPPVIIVLEFFETRNGYKFYGYDKFG